MADVFASIFEFIFIPAFMVLVWMAGWVSGRNAEQRNVNAALKTLKEYSETVEAQSSLIERQNNTIEMLRSRI